jgi:hypothetical protein
VSPLPSLAFPILSPPRRTLLAEPSPRHDSNSRASSIHGCLPCSSLVQRAGSSALPDGPIPLAVPKILAPWRHGSEDSFHSGEGPAPTAAPFLITAIFVPKGCGFQWCGRWSLACATAPMDGSPPGCGSRRALQPASSDCRGAPLVAMAEPEQSCTRASLHVLCACVPPAGGSSASG